MKVCRHDVSVFIQAPMRYTSLWWKITSPLLKQKRKHIGYEDEQQMPVVKVARKSRGVGGRRGRGQGRGRGRGRRLAAAAVPDDDDDDMFGELHEAGGLDHNEQEENQDAEAAQMSGEEVTTSDSDTGSGSVHVSSMPGSESDSSVDESESVEHGAGEASDMNTPVASPPRECPVDMPPTDSPVDMPPPEVLLPPLPRLLSRW
jgi:hypothetical protein